MSLTTNIKTPPNLGLYMTQSPMQFCCLQLPSLYLADLKLDPSKSSVIHYSKFTNPLEFKFLRCPSTHRDILPQAMTLLARLRDHGLCIGDAAAGVPADNAWSNHHTPISLCVCHCCVVHVRLQADPQCLELMGDCWGSHPGNLQ